MTDRTCAKWSNRFLTAAIIHGLGIAVWSALFLVDQIGITLNFSRIIAGGGAGMWFTVGYVLYMIAGFVGNATFALVHYLLPNSNRTVFSDKMAALHFALYNAAVVGATLLLGYAGWIGGSLALAKKGELIHTTIVVYVQPIGYFVLIGAISALVFVVNVALGLRKAVMSVAPMAASETGVSIRETSKAA